MTSPVRKPNSAAPAVPGKAGRDVYDEIADEREFPQEDGLDTVFLIRVGAVVATPSPSRLVLLLAPLIRPCSRLK